MAGTASKSEAEQYMLEAIRLAALGLATTDPNPRVGCVIAKDGQVVGQGFHKIFGGAHAEIEALRDAGEAAQSAEVFVTLEPCSHQGKTGPCVKALIGAGVRKVTAAMQDPNPRVSGEGFAQLRSAGIEVEVGICESEAMALNPGFIKRMTTGLPWVRCKLASSLDGRVALENGESQWISSPEALADVHAWRARSSAIVVGVGTALADQPSLTARPLGKVSARQPWRIVLDTHLRSDLSAAVFNNDGKAKVYCGESASQAQLERFRSAGVDTTQVPTDNGGLDLASVLKDLAASAVNEVQVEAGPTLQSAFLRSSLVDEWLVYVSPLILGPSAKPMFDTPDMLVDMNARVALHIVDVQQFGQTLRLSMKKPSKNHKEKMKS